MKLLFISWLYLNIFIVSFCLLFIITDAFYFYNYYLKTLGVPTSIKNKVKKRSLFLVIFRDFPRLLGRYFYEKKNAFEDYGIIIFYGPQGCGKTVSVSHYALQMQKKYKNILIGSNYDLALEDFKIKSWKVLIDKKNGEYPICFCIDELNQWANSRDWQHMPKSILGELCFQRKNKRLILGTAQSISQIDKQIRLQCGSGEFRRCFCWLGFINIVVRLRPEFDTEGNLIKKHFKGFYIYLQDEKIRSLYDTFKTIERLADCKVVNNENKTD